MLGLTERWRKAMLKRFNRTGSDALHPWRYVTGALGGGPLVGQLKRSVSRLLYEYLAHTYPLAEWTTMNYGYAERTDTPPFAIAIDAPERFALWLYSRVAGAGSHSETFAGLDVLEIGSGRGGGAAFISRNLEPRTMVALDFSSSATALARKYHQHEDSLEYVQGDAEGLSFDTERFDIVLNIESAHCYGSFLRFLSEVHRVLRPGGELLFADFASKRNGALERMRGALADSPLRLVKIDDITANVVRALELDEARKSEMLERWISGPFKSFARGAYAMEGTAMRRELESGQTVYILAVLRKDDMRVVDSSNSSLVAR